jgi:hypothetical protein
VITAVVTPMSANARPVSAPKSSSSTTGNSGDFVRRMNASQVAPRRDGSDSRTAVRSENDSSPIAMTRTAKAQIGDSMSCGCRSFCHPSYRAKTPPTRKITMVTRKP